MSLTNKAVSLLAPQSGRGGAGENVASDADDRVDMVGPLGVCQPVARQEDLDQTRLVTRTALLVSRARVIERRRGLAQRRGSVMHGWLVCLDLSDQMNAGFGSLLECFF
jgi:hypothetical protein